MMEAASTSETLVNFYQTTQRYNPEDSHFRTHRRENLKSNFKVFIFSVLSELKIIKELIRFILKIYIFL
jgi:hypothetical protein